MNLRYLLCATIFAAAFCAPAVKAQTDPHESATALSSFRAEDAGTNINAVTLKPKSESSRPSEISGQGFRKKQFVALSVGVYAASLADMHQTLHFRNQSWWYEKDPLARPMVRLPAPAYYATGLALATGVNWLGWKMGHSRKWRKLAPLPQLFSIAGNTGGFASNFH